jgi:hypothetical protein
LPYEPGEEDLEEPGEWEGESAVSFSFFLDFLMLAICVGDERVFCLGWR